MLFHPSLFGDPLSSPPPAISPGYR
jgi:hypothetical protein